MEKRKLGNGNLEVSAIGLGCMGMSSEAVDCSDSGYNEIASVDGKYHRGLYPTYS